LTQIIEYALVMLISSLFAGASAVTYTNYKNIEGNVAFAAAFSGISTLAEQALANGSSHSNMLLPSSIVSCSGGILSLSSAGRTAMRSLMVGCDFSFVVTGGPHSLEFSYGNAMLMLQVG
jgi:hypothetical protein